MLEAIQRVYEVFSAYKKPRDFEACEHCISDVDKRDLLRPNLHELTGDELSKYAADAFFTMGGVPDFKYFLPRILELTVTELWWPDPEIVLAKLRFADWDGWPETERAAVLALLNKKFTAVLEDPNAEGSAIDTWLCALARCLDDITPYLDLLLSKASEEKLLSFIEWNNSVLTRGKLSNPFWDSPQNERRLIEWFSNDRVKQLLNKKYGVIF